MKKILILSFLLAFAQMRSQNNLPFSAPGICLDFVKQIGSPAVSQKNLIVKDFNNDGFDEVLVSDINTNSGTVFVYKYNPVAGNFVIAFQFPCPIGRYGSLDVGNVDADNFKDLVICDSLGRIKVYKNSSVAAGSISFNTTPNYTVQVNSLSLATNYKAFPSFLKLGDVNGDNLDEIALALPSLTANGYGVLMLRNTAPTFTLDYVKQVFDFVGTPPLSTVNPVMDMDFGHYNTDIVKDLYLTSRGQNSVVTILQNTAPTPTAAITAQTFSKTISIVSNIYFDNIDLSDQNGDGYDEIAIRFSYILYASPSPSLNSITNGAAIISGSTLATYSNISAAQINENFLINTITSTGTVLPQNYDIKFGDLDKDGFKDLVLINGSNMMLGVFKPLALGFNNIGTFGDGGGNITYSITLPPNTKADEIVYGDFDNNSLLDIFYKPCLQPSGPVTVIPNYSFKFHAFAIDSTICYGKVGTASLTLTPTITTSPSYSVNWFSPLSPGNSVSSGAQLSTTNTGLYYPVIKLYSPTTNTQICSISNKDTITIKEIASPTVNLANLAPYQYCAGSNVTFTATSSGINNVLPPKYSWGGTGFSSTGPTITRTITGQEFYTVSVKDSLTKCISQDLQFSVNAFSDTSKIIAEKLLVCMADSVRLSFPNVIYYTWSYYPYQGSPTTVFLSTQPSIYVKPSQGTTYQLDYVDTHTCTSNKQIHINVDPTCEIKIYNVVTPNGDNINDVWTIDNITRYPNNHVEVYNRWGINVFDVKSYDNVKNFWPPKDFHKAPSTYFYIIDLGDGSAKIKGWIELITD